MNGKHLHVRMQESKTFKFVFKLRISKDETDNSSNTNFPSRHSIANQMTVTHLHPILDKHKNETKEQVSR